jgi:hypothetical protein
VKPGPRLKVRQEEINKALQEYESAKEKYGDSDFRTTKALQKYNTLKNWMWK